MLAPSLAHGLNSIKMLPFVDPQASPVQLTGFDLVHPGCAPAATSIDLGYSGCDPVCESGGSVELPLSGSACLLHAHLHPLDAK